METMNRYNVHSFGAAPDEDYDVERNPEGRWFEAVDVLRELGERDAREFERDQLNETLRGERDELKAENRKLDDKIDELILECRLQTKRAEDMVSMNANLIAARNHLVLERDRAVLSARLSNKMRTAQYNELVQLRARVGHLTGRVIDSAVLLNRLVNGGTKNPWEVVQQAREFVGILRTDTEGYTMTGPCDIPLLYGKIDLLNEDGTPMPTNEQQTPMPAPESGVGFEPPSIKPVVAPRPVAPGLVGRRASDGTLVAVHPDFAKQLDESPELWQGCVDAAAKDAKRLGIDAANPSEDDKRKLMQSVVNATPAPAADIEF